MPTANPYLADLEKQYEAIRQSVAGIQQRAKDAGRGLVDDEKLSIKQQDEKLGKLAEEIEMIRGIEKRNLAVDALTRDINNATGPAPEPAAYTPTNSAAPETRTVPLGGATTSARDPGHYRLTGEHSFFRDKFRAQYKQDKDAARRLVENTNFVLQATGMTEDQVRALTSSGEGGGVLQPNWMTQLFTARASFGRPLTQLVNNIPITDARTITIPKQTADTDDVVDVQASENTAPGNTNAWDSDVDNITPIAITGEQDFSRQMLDGGNPATDLLIATDLRKSYDKKVERRTVLIIEQANTSLMTATAGSDPNVSTHYNKRAMDLLTEVFASSELQPDLLFSSPRRYGKALGLTDTTGRPLISARNPSNASGEATLRGAFGGGVWWGTEFIASPGELDDGRVYAIVRDEVLHFEAPVLEYTFTEKKGPATIVVGIWGYNGWFVRRKPSVVKGMSITGDGESA